MSLKTDILKVMQTELANGNYSVQLKDMLIKINIVGLTESVLKVALQELVKRRGIIQIGSKEYSFPSEIVNFYKGE